MKNKELVVIKVTMDLTVLAFKHTYQSGMIMPATLNETFFLFSETEFTPFGKRGNQFVWLIKKAPK